MQPLVLRQLMILNLDNYFHRFHQKETTDGTKENIDATNNQYEFVNIQCKFVDKNFT